MLGIQLASYISSNEFLLHTYSHNNYLLSAPVPDVKCGPLHCNMSSAITIDRARAHKASCYHEWTSWQGKVLQVRAAWSVAGAAWSVAGAAWSVAGAAWSVAGAAWSVAGAP